MVMFFNTTDTIGFLIVQTTQNVTGTLDLTLGLIIFFALAVMFMFKLPTELVLLFSIPLILIIMAFSSTFMTLGIIMILYFAVVFAREFFIR